MNKNYVVGAVIILGVLIIGGLVIFRTRGSVQGAQTTTPIAQNTQKTEVPVNDPDGGIETPESIAREKAEYEKIKTADPISATSQGVGEYKDYSPETLQSEQKLGHKVVLFFHAPWCPYCRTADKDFKDNLNKIPAGVTLLKTDYDSNTELKKKYGVTYQHTFVQIDNDGNKIAFWVSGATDELITNVK